MGDQEGGSGKGLTMKVGPLAIAGMLICVVGILVFFILSVNIAIPLGIILIGVGIAVAVVGIVQSARRKKVQG